MTKQTNTGVRGIYQRNNHTFEASLVVRRKKSNRSLSVHIGSYRTLEEAIDGRRNYIMSL